MKLTTQKLKKLIQEELSEMMEPSESGEASLESIQQKVEKALEHLYTLNEKFNFKTDPETAKVLGMAVHELEKADYDMRGLLGIRPDDELDLY